MTSSQPKETIGLVVVLTPKRTLRAKRHFALTVDGWKIALHHYRPPGGPRVGHPPILLCHGLGANRYNLDAPGGLSLARWLCKRGFDCWVIELRGAGESSRPRLLNRLRYNWTFDDHVQKDIPAVFDTIERLTGSREVHWIGHSMGGMVAYAYLMTQDPTRIRSLMAIASPAFAHLSHPFFDRILGFRHVIKLLPRLPYSTPGKLLAPIIPLFKYTTGRLVANPKNMRNSDFQKLAFLVPQDLPTSLLAQVADWYATGEFKGAKGVVRYDQLFDRVKVPTLLVSGAADRLTPTKDIQHVFDRIGSADKKLLQFGRESGCRYDYGHIDLVLGQYAPREVFPHLLAWLEAH